MSRRFGAKISVANVQAIETVIDAVGKPYVPRRDPFQELSNEIEKCRRKIWQCTGQTEGLDGRSKHADHVTATELNESNSVRSKTRSAQVNYVSNGEKKGIRRADIEFKVNAMKVVEMREECRKHGLDTKGIKKVLRARLLAHLLEETQQQENAGVLEKPDVEPMKVDSAENVDVDMHIVPTDSCENKEIHSTDKKEEQAEAAPARVSCSSTQAEYHVPEASGKKEAERNAMEPSGDDDIKADPASSKPEIAPAAVKEELHKVVAFPANMPSKSPLPNLVKGALRALDGSIKKMPKAATISDQPLIPEDDISPPASEVSSAASSSKMSGNRVRDIVSKLSQAKNTSASTSTQNVGTGSALSKSVQAKKEARMARMAEIREKSQQAKALTASKPVLVPKEYTPGLSSLNATIVSGGAKKNLAAQMREKALRKENAPTNQLISSSTKTGKRTLPLSQSNVPDVLGTTMKSGLGSTLKYGLSNFKKPKVASPMDTYEISDREDSDTDDSGSEDEREKKTKKKIPLWAKKENLLPALEEQYLGCVDGKRVDPDDIFPEVATCDLEAIFGSRKNAKYRSRTSSGNWSRDQVTAAEKLVYKRTMGFAMETSEV